MARRDRLVREALVAHFPGKPTPAARALASAWVTYIFSNWPAEKDLAALPDTASPRHAALHAITRASDGKPLGWRQILTISAIK
jgi:hypothetical protein